MREQLLTNPHYVESKDPHSINFECDHKFTIQLSTLQDGILRLLVTSPSHPVAYHDNVLEQAYQHDDSSFKLLENDREKQVWLFRLQNSKHWPDLQAKASVSSGGLVIELIENGRTIHRDLPGRSYSSDGEGFNHYSFKDPDWLHFGMGEVAAPLNLNSRRIEFYSRDALAYDAYRTNPLYKQHPILVSLPKGGGTALAEFNPTNVHGYWDIGNELDGYWKTYKLLKLDRGGLEKFYFTGTNTEALMSKYAKLTGQPLIPARHWLGYLGSSMLYAESENAQEVVQDFPNKLKQYDIPCSAIHLSSGYTVTEQPPLRRNVFNINRKRFPDFKGMCDFLHDHGIRISTNIKPYLSVAHPGFEGLKAKNALFMKPDSKEPVVVRVWATVNMDDNSDGSWIDLTSKAGREFWVENSKKLLSLGVDSLWNDNNEFALLNDDYLCQYEDIKDGVKGPVPIGVAGRLINTEMMAKCSSQASLEVYPDRRPFTISRSTNPGTLRYAASSWSGDNATKWSNLKGNTIMVLNAGLSLIHSYGSDVGGFLEDVPDEEIFLRWVQIAIFNPRFCIHSNNKGKKVVTEPWMYPKILPIIRRYIKRRYELIPFFYALHWESHLHGMPLNRWLGYGPYQQDPEVYTEENLDGADFWLGDALLVAGVFEPGTLSRKVYLPKSTGAEDELYFDISNHHKVYKAGTYVTVATPFDNIALFVKAGSAIPIGKPLITATTTDGYLVDAIKNGMAELDDWRGLEIFPPPAEHSNGQKYTYTWIEDDGESLHPEPSKFQVVYTANKDNIEVQFSVVEDRFKPLWKSIDIILPLGDSRHVVGGVKAADRNNCPTFSIIT